ncbi:hypothetical protein [Alteraurantiacibacter buctensis]|uniref:Uncharacterized protein n=1 Tax=Alteraurantiacibacter buctensis TaxID=1503981 RepID=A0A844Z1F7_9SPHN|nr:hypothetical protein [Alteraurantiacibacter buctensis]MXO73178.1 hypothetical protein [Alteraurantiacibacter buctensis]
MSTKRFESLTALTREGLLLRVECRCGRVVLLDPAKLLDRSLAAGGGHLISKVASRLRCGDCGARPSHFGPG